MEQILHLFALPAAAAKPAAGAALGEVIGATAGATLATALLLGLIARHRAREGTLLERCAAFTERLTGLPGWASLPSAVGASSLLVALVGMYWDISLHIDQGRDPGPLANPAHYLILVGLFGVFAAGCLAVALPKERPGPAAVRISDGWFAPVGGILMAAAGAFALLGFPLDDVWHRLFGQDVTLWGPTHLMLIGGAGMTLIGQAILLGEGTRARAPSEGAQAPSLATRVAALRRLAAMGGLLIGLSTFQGEFDFGIPQFRMVFQPLLIALAAGVALVAARIWIGRGGALGAAVFFLVVRGAVSLIVGPVFGETTPALPLYLGEALCVEAVALLLSRERPLALGAVAGLTIGTFGFAIEWGWSHLVMPLPWGSDLLAEGLVCAVVAGIAGGVIGGLLGAGLRSRLPRPLVTRVSFGLALVAVAALVANGLLTQPAPAAVAAVSLTDVQPPPNRAALATVRVSPPQAAQDPAWLTMTAWQGGGLVVDRLKPVARGVYRSTRPVPLYGEWKSMLRLQRGRVLVAVPVYLPEDRAIPAPAVPARARFTRRFEGETPILQRERKRDVAPWLFAVASLVVGVIALAFIAALAWGVGRIARAGTDRPPRRPPSSLATPRPVQA